MNQRKPIAVVLAGKRLLAVRRECAVNVNLFGERRPHAKLRTASVRDDAQVLFDLMCHFLKLYHKRLSQAKTITIWRNFALY